MTSTTATLTHCPTCGVKLERPELSMCAYCASPLRVGPVEVPNDETQKRLAKVRSHADFAAAQSWLPIDPLLDRRSETSVRGGVGSTTYVFKIRFEDGSEGEFTHVGRGSMYDPPANGAAGVAYTRGPRMLEFRRI